MTDPNAVLIGVTCECGEKYQIGVAGLDLETMEFTCPRCGDVDRFTPEQVAQIVDGHKRAAKQARETARKSFSNIIRKLK